MRIEKEKQDKKLSLKIIGRLDASTSPALQKVADSELEEITELEIDMEEMEYVSSAGLRVLLCAEKKMKAKEGGTMTLFNVNDEVMGVFEITGFKDLLCIR